MTVAIELSSPATAATDVSGVEVVQATFEHAGSRGSDFLPQGLVATNPTLVTLLAVRASDGPHGPFTFAQVRVSCRSGARARALVVATAVDAGADATAWLASHWGIAGDGPVRLDRRYDLVRVDAPWFDVSITSPKPIGVHDVQYVAGLHPVTTASGERLAQVELEIALDRVERGRPVLQRFEGPPGATALDPRFAVAATSGVGTLTLPHVRFVLRPDVAAHVGTERVGAAA